MSGFWQILVRPEDRWKCDFVTHHGVWMPFGLRNAPVTFVKSIRKILFPIRDHSDAYIDDTYTISNSFADHIEHLRAFLCVIKNAVLTLILNKCKFAQTTTKFVGFLVRSGTIQPIQSLVGAVLLLPDVCYTRLHFFIFLLVLDTYSIMFYIFGFVSSCCVQ